MRVLKPQSRVMFPLTALLYLFWVYLRCRRTTGDSYSSLHSRSLELFRRLFDICFTQDYYPSRTKEVSLVGQLFG
jgi:hypothetical protein